MQTIANQTISTTYTGSETRTNIFTRFFAWAKDQEGNRLLWLGIILAAHGCVLTPITVMAVLLAGTNLTLFVIALVAMGMSLVTNLAAMPTKITIPVFVLSILIDVVIISLCVVNGFDIAKTYI